MSAEEEKLAALVPIETTALTKAGAQSLFARGQADLRIREEKEREEAEEWLRKGLALQNDAPPSHWPPAPINPYAASQPAMSAEVQRIKQQEEREQLKKRDEMLKEAFRCFECGYQLDPSNPELLFCLANSYYQGDGVMENQDKAVTLYQHAADMGHAGSQTAIGDAHAQCGFTCLPKNEMEAARWYQAAAEQGDEEAVGMIVDMYQRGEGVKLDHAEAARLLRNALARGDETARHNLRLYAKQYGSPYEDGDADTP
jgi:TPR repeat protein